MSKQQVEIFMPPNRLKAKVGGEGGLDLSAVKRAEAAIEELNRNLDIETSFKSDATRLFKWRFRKNGDAATKSRPALAAADVSFTSRQPAPARKQRPSIVTS